jgi:hypothetical protein
MHESDNPYAAPDDSRRPEPLERPTIGPWRKLVLVLAVLGLIVMLYPWAAQLVYLVVAWLA